MTTWYKYISCNNLKAVLWYILKYISIEKYDINVLIYKLNGSLSRSENILVGISTINWICYNSSNRSFICSWVHLNSARLSSSKYRRDGRNPRAQDRGSPGAFSLPSLNILIVRLLWIEHLDHSPPILLVVDDVN